MWHLRAWPQPLNSFPLATRCNTLVSSALIIYHKLVWCDTGIFQDSNRLICKWFFTPPLTNDQSPLTVVPAVSSSSVTSVSCMILIVTYLHFTTYLQHLILLLKPVYPSHLCTVINSSAVPWVPCMTRIRAWCVSLPPLAVPHDDWLSPCQTLRADWIWTDFPSKRYWSSSEAGTVGKSVCSADCLRELGIWN